MKAFSSLLDQTFLKICVELDAELFRRGVTLRSSKFYLSIPVSKGMEGVWFDFSSCMRSMLGVISEDSFSHEWSSTSAHVRYRYKVWDEYLDKNNEVVSSIGQATSYSKNFYAIPGELTDMQRLLAPQDTASLLGNVKVMSNKPDGEVVPVGGESVLSVFSRQNGTADILFNGNATSYEAVFYEMESSAFRFAFPSRGACSLSFSGVSHRAIKYHAVASPGKPYAYFEFVNRLGALESVYCYGLRGESSRISAERNALHQGMTYKPSGRFFRRVKSSEETLSLSTGPVSREWAKWFVDDFFRSGHVWMKDSVSGQMVPVLIELEEDTDLYDDSEAQVIDLPFKVVKSYTGYSTGSFLS